MKSASLNDFSWFKPTNYEVLAQFDVNDWASILHQRLVIHAVLKDDDLRMLTVPLYEDIVTGNISTSNQSDFGLGKQTSQKRFIADTNDHVAFWDHSHVIQYVLPFSVESARLAYEDVRDFALEQHCVFEPSEAFGLDIPYFEGVYPIDFLVNQKIAPHAAVELDLSAPDDVIIAELKKFLPKYRQALELKNDSKVTDIDVAKLRSYRVIEYFDIQIWLRMNKCEVTDSLLSVVLFPDRDDHQTFFAQTVKRFLKRVGTYAYTQALFARCSSIHHK